MNPKTNQLETLAGGRSVDYEITDEYEDKVVDRGTEYSNDGTVSFSCDESGFETVDTEMTLDEPGGLINFHRSTNTGLLTLSGGAPLGACGNTFETRIGASYWTYNLYQEVAQESQNFLGENRGTVAVYESGTPSFVSGSGTAFYYPEEQVFWKDLDSIYLVVPENHDGTSGDRRVAAHELGHAMHEENLGLEFSDQCPDAHYSNLATNMKCAFAEGFAIWHASELSFTNYESFPENNSEEFIDPEDYNGDGARVEEYFSSFLHDIVDPANEPHDKIKGSGKYVADVIKSCERELQGAWVDGNNRVDWVVGCFQNEAPDYDNYFPNATGNLPTDARENASEPSSWSESRMRDLWKNNLYPDGSPEGSDPPSDPSPPQDPIDPPEDPPRPKPIDPVRDPILEKER
ncbi:hypothetical protein [Salinibacter altiplanensis]|uniref:hypothetical protein n=1 Tax=Salinibacter altiplanensis TaxID=1803181 RepID=UPI001F21E556|nr:hypothetical protein [Salinibacter altiplanensis]